MVKPKKKPVRRKNAKRRKTDNSLFAASLRETFAQPYERKHFKSDFIAALIVSLVALPLSMALSIAIGLPPQNGLYTAIVAGIVVALLGGSRMQVTGPTAAFVVILAPIVASYGLRGIIWCEIFAGITLLVLGITRIGRNIKHVPYPVVIGFTTGIAVVIFTLALNDLLGLGIKSLNGGFLNKIFVILVEIPEMHVAEAVVGIVTLLTIIYSGRVVKFLPPYLTGIITGGVLAAIFSACGLHIDTIYSHFTFGTGKDLRHGIPPYLPGLHFPGENSKLFTFPTWHELGNYIPNALIIAALAALESLLSATVADSLAKTKHNPNAELNALGIGNIITAMFTGIPATGAIARTSANIHSGAYSPFASVMHSIFILIFMLALTPLINEIPMASLSALLAVVAYKMSHYKQFYGILRNGENSEIIVLLGCFAFTVLFDMVAGVAVGIILSVAIYAKRRFWD